MRRLSALIIGLGMALAAGAAQAHCPAGHDHQRDDVRRYEDARWDDGDHWYGGSSYEAARNPDRDWRYADDGDGNRRYDDRRYDDRRYDDRDDDRGYGDRYAYDDQSYDDDGAEYYGARWYGASPWWRDGRFPAPPCPCETAGGALRISDGFFYDTGGVGPIPDGGYDYGYGGGGFFVMGGARGSGFSSARASSSASSSASANVSIRARGGFRGGYHGGHGGYGGKHH